MISFTNGHSFEFMTASGALAFDGRGWPWEWPFRWTGLLDPSLFTIVTKTLTRHPRPGNLRWSHPWSVVKKIDSDGWLNAIGLTNKGIEWWTQGVSPRIPTHYKIIVSIEADDEKEMGEMLEQLAGQKILGVELNLSCPNTLSVNSRTTDKILTLCESAAQKTHFPLIAKLSCTHDYTTLISRLESCKKIEAVSINSVPWPVLYPGKPSPLARYGGGGVSGKKIQSMTWKMVDEISRLSKIPVIGPSVWDYDDIEKLFRIGARAISFGSLFISKPWRPTLFTRKWQKQNLLAGPQFN